MAAKVLKLAGIVVAVLGVLGIALGAFLSSRYFAASVETLLAKAMQEAKQRTLKFDGALEISFWPNAGFTAGRVSLSERGSTQEFASFDAARVSVAVLPLFARQVVVEDLTLNGLKVGIVKHADGSLNIDDLLVSQKPAGTPLQFDIAAVKLGGATLTWHDEKSGGTTTVSGLDFATGRVQADTGSKAFRVDNLAFAATADGIRTRVALGGVDGSATALKAASLAFDIDAKAGTTAVRGTLNAALAADFAQGTLALENLSGDVDIAHPHLATKHITLPLRGDLRAGLATAAGHLSTQFDESKAVLQFKVARFAPLALHFDLAIDRLDVDRYLLPQPAAARAENTNPFDLSAFKDLELDGTVRIGSLQVANLKASNVKLQIKAANGKLDVGGLDGRDGN
ncbi:MAG: AsmA family protein [Rhodocyclaceae bacterium]|nr:AsmA family protein [Rhodocyclaceae bacterium]